jgi:hypothetical protein
VRDWLEPMKPQPQFLRIRWEETREQNGAITLEAMACLRHRREIALAYPAPEAPAVGGGTAATSAPASNPKLSDPSSPNSRRSQLGSPDGSWHPGRSRRPTLSNKSGISALLQGARGDCDAGKVAARDPQATRAYSNNSILGDGDRGGDDL